MVLIDAALRYEVAVSVLLLSGMLILVVVPSMDAGSVRLCRWSRGMILTVAAVNVAVGIGLSLLGAT